MAAIKAQQENAETYYSINQDLTAIKANDVGNNEYRTIEK